MCCEALRMKTRCRKVICLLPTTFLWLIIALVVTSCDDHSVSKKVTDSAKTIKLSDKKGSLHLEDFDIFLKQFNTDCDFQKRHVKFPLQSISNVDWEINDYDTSFLKVAEYVCIELTSPKSNIFDGEAIVKITHKTEDLVIISFGVDGICLAIDYYFQKDAMNWRLIKVIDEST